MKMKNLLFVALATLGLTGETIAQNLPNYLPANGLVGWWPFNANANDESGNSFNGATNGASLSNDRFGLPNSSYNFNGTSDYITIPANVNNTVTGPYSISFWIKNNDGLNVTNGHEVIGDRDASSYNHRFRMNFGIAQAPFLQDTSYIEAVVANQQYTILSSIPTVNSWEHYVISYSSINQVLSAYKNGLLINSINNVPFEPNARQINVGRSVSPAYPNGVAYYNGNIDDIGYWSRTLSQQEIIDLYNGCQLSVNIQPTNQTINVNNSAQFITSSSDPAATYQWQTDLGFGFQNMNSVGQYSGTTNDTLTVSNVTMSNNNQPFRCIVSSGSCSDTSNVAVLTVNNNVGINENTQDNLFSVFPNPAQSVINVKADSKLLGQVYSIYDNTGRVVLTGKLNSENTTIELGNLSGGVFMFRIGENMKQTFKVIKE